MVRRTNAPARLRACVAMLAVALVVASTASCIKSPNLSTLNEADDAAGGSEAAAMDAGSEGAPDEDVATDPAHAACVAVCPAGGTCDGATCVLACPGVASCAMGVKCPPGIPCRITCTGVRSCGTADCGAASTCRVECTGDEACARVRSAAPQTDVVCSGKDACRDTMCSGATCSVQCDGNACKVQDVQCCATQCKVNGAPGQCQ